MEISVVVPFYNEEIRMEPGLSQSLEYLQQNLKSPFEVIFVNDGSTDNTLAILEKVKNSHQNLTIRIISYEQNRGKGYAVKTGVLCSEGEKIVVTDADFSISLTEIDRFIEELDRYDIVIGSKKHALTNTLVSQNALRRFLGKAFTVLVNSIFGLSYTDVTCGFKGFRSATAKDIFTKQITKRWSYDAEVLFLATRKGYRIKEIPVEWKHVQGGTISPVSESFRSLRDITLIVIYFLLGKYK